MNSILSYDALGQCCLATAFLSWQYYRHAYKLWFNLWLKPEP